MLKVSVCALPKISEVTSCPAPCPTIKVRAPARATGVPVSSSLSFLAQEHVKLVPSSHSRVWGHWRRAWKAGRPHLGYFPIGVKIDPPHSYRKDPHLGDDGWIMSWAFMSGNWGPTGSLFQCFILDANTAPARRHSSAIRRERGHSASMEGASSANM